MNLSTLKGTLFSTKARAATTAATAALCLFGAISLYVYLVYVAANAVSVPAPDELSALNLTKTFGILGTILYYWENFVGRFSATTWLVLQLWSADSLGITPWSGFVALRSVNHILLVLGFYALLRLVYPESGRLSSIVFAIAFHALVYASQDLARIGNYWLFDQAIYLVTFSTYCLLLGLFWRIATKGLDLWAALSPLVWLIFLGAHEINLATGGILLGLFAISIAYSSLKSDGMVATLRLWLRAHYRRGGIKERYARLLSAYCVTFVLAALLQVMSPSVAYRNSHWVPEVGSVEALISYGVQSSFTPLLELLLGFEGSVLPLLFAGCIFGILWHQADSARRMRGYLLVPLALALVTTVIMGVLLETTGQLLSKFDASQTASAQKFSQVLVGSLADWRYADSQKSFFIYQVWFLAAFFLGAFLGAETAYRLRRHDALRQKLSLVTAPIGAVWFLYALFSSPGLGNAVRFDPWAELAAMNQRFEVLTRQGTNAYSFTGPTPHIEEYLNYHPSLMEFAPETYPYESELARTYTKPAFIFVPCTLTGALNDCLSRSKKYVRRVLAADDTAALAELWQDRVPGPRSGPQLGLSSDQEMAAGLTTADLRKGTRTLIEVTLDFRSERDLEEGSLALKLSSADGAAHIAFPTPAPGLTDDPVRFALTTSEHDLDGFTITRNLPGDAEIYYFVPPDGRHRPSPGMIWSRGMRLASGTARYSFDSRKLPAEQRPFVYFLVRHDAMTSGILIAPHEDEKPETAPTVKPDEANVARRLVSEAGTAKILDWRWVSDPARPTVFSFTTRFFVSGPSESFTLGIEGGPNADGHRDSSDANPVKVTGTKIRVVDTSPQSEAVIDRLVEKSDGLLSVVQTSWQFDPGYAPSPEP